MNHIANALYGLGCDCVSNAIAQQKFEMLNALGATTFNAAEIVGKTLTAKRSVPVRTAAIDANPVVYTVKPGEIVGVVSSYLNPKDGRSSLYWEINQNGKYFYVPHAEGAFDVNALKIQGAISTEDKYKQAQDEAAREADPVQYYFKKIGIPVILIVGGIIVVKTIAPKLVDKILPSKTPAAA